MKKMLSKTYEAINYFILFSAAAFFLFPMYWMIIGSFKNQSAAIKIPPEFIPHDPTLINYIKLITDGDILIWFKNSVIVAGASVVILCLIATMAAYALTKTELYGKKMIFTAVIIAMLIPRQITLVPYFTLMRDMNLINKLPSAVLAVIIMPFGVFLMKQFSQTIPTELMQAARIDGASEFGIFFRIFMPIVKPGIGALAIFTFANAWNDYMWQLVLLSSRRSMTLPVGIATLVGQYIAEYGQQMAAATLGFIPTTILFISFQSYFIKGITLGGVKG